MGLHGMPGIGGGLGICALCGKSFVTEVLLGTSIRAIGIDGFDDDLCMHASCIETMEGLRGQSWESLPDGPLRKAYANTVTAEPEDGA